MIYFGSIVHVKFALSIVFIVGSVFLVSAQEFINSGLEGNVTSISIIAEHWSNVSNTDSICDATTSNQATPDLTNEYGPSPTYGIAGKPHSGNSFVSGVSTISRVANLQFHEGIQQTVAGFNVDSVYTIGLYQSVVKQINTLDSTGSWEVFLDGVSIGITEPSYSSLEHTDLDLIWDYREIYFVAKKPFHLIQFLPKDDDDSIMGNWQEDYYPGLRMGIDDLGLFEGGCAVVLDLGPDLSLCEGDSMELVSNIKGGLYEWQDGTSSDRIIVRESGLYWVEVEKTCQIQIDSISVSYLENPIVDLGPDTVMCSNLGFWIDVGGSYSMVIWWDQSTDQAVYIEDVGVYSVSVSSGVCMGYDTLEVGSIFCDVCLEFPNIITPNLDAKNDVFVPYCLEGITEMTTKIHNRWGKKVYETNSLFVNWTAEGVNDGVYYWSVDYQDVNGVEGNVNGVLTVVR